MVICTYFLNNTCRFGTKCHNEHVNVKLTLKTDAEGALKGNQWPISSYGPFRDKPCISNFIEDQSFEEARHLCYEAKATGNVQMVTSQFTQNVLDAKNKMNMLTNPTDEVVMLVTNLYNSSCTTTPSQAPNANPFGMGASGMNSGGSIFGGGNATTNSNLFGSSSAANNVNPFARNAAGFGAPAQGQSTNLFGNASTAVSTAASIFGGSSNTTSTSLFGGSSFSNTSSSSAFPSSTMSAFGGASTFGGTTSGGAFSQQSTGASPFSLPSNTNQTTNLFGGQSQSNPVFGGGATFGSQVKTGLFGQANATLGAPAPSTGTIFGQTVQNSAFGAPAQTNLFGNASQTQSQSIFGGQQTMQAQDNPFAAVAQSATTNIFGNTQIQQQPQQQQLQSQQQQLQPPQQSPFQSSTNVFGGNTNAFGGNQPIFGGNQNQTMNQMGVVPTPAQQPSLQQQQQSIFGTNSFSVQQNSQPVQTPFGGNVFQSQQEQPKPPTQMFGGQMQPQQNPFGAQPAQISKTLYTPMDSLDPDELEAFKSNTFDISKIPTKPPPMELCT